MYSNSQQTPVYNSLSTVPFAQTADSNQYESIQYASNLSTNQSMYNSVPYQSPIYSIPTQEQQQYSEYPQYVDNIQVNPQGQSTYQGISQPGPPSYDTVVQSSSSYPVIAQQQPVLNSNSNSGATNKQLRGVPFSKDYKWPRRSVSLVCPICGATVTTRVETTTTIITILSAILLFFFTFILVCLPFCIPAFKKSTHYCPHCYCILGVRHELR